jgi:hypothetical protein
MNAISIPPSMLILTPPTSSAGRQPVTAAVRVATRYVGILATRRSRLLLDSDEVDVARA